MLLAPTAMHKNTTEIQVIKKSGPPSASSGNDPYDTRFCSFCLADSLPHTQPAEERDNNLKAQLIFWKGLLLGWFCSLSLPTKKNSIFLPLSFSFSISFFSANHRVGKEYNRETFGSTSTNQTLLLDASTYPVSTSTW